LIAASVWIKLEMLGPFPPPLSPRAFALTIPAVTVDDKLYGFPTAITHSPTLRLSESPIGRVGRFLPSILIRARSVVGSVPIIRAENSLLSLSVTVSSSAPFTTWLFVTIYPSALMITPEPVAYFFGV
jgi:hypothetical protein